MAFCLFNIQIANAETQYLSCKVSGDYVIKGAGGGKTQPNPAEITVEINKGNGFIAIGSSTASSDYKFGAFNNCDGKYKCVDGSTNKQYSLITNIPSEKTTYEVALNRVTGDLSVTNRYDLEGVFITFSGKCEPIMSNKF